MSQSSNLIAALEAATPAPRVWKEPGRPMLWFTAGATSVALGLPALIAWSGIDIEPPPGVVGGTTLFVFYGLVLLAVGTVALTSLSLGRAVRRNRRAPRYRAIPIAGYALGGILFPALFLAISLFTTWGSRVTGLHWAIAIAGPFLLGLYTAPRGAAPELPEHKGNTS